MNTLVDTPVWSEYYRRAVPQNHVQSALEALVRARHAILIGPVRQEVLSGIKEPSQFELLRSALRRFANFPIQLEDYELAARSSNFCQTRGIQGSATDFLLCAISVRSGAAIFTLDKDFERFAEILDVQLFSY